MSKSPKSLDPNVPVGAQDGEAATSEVVKRPDPVEGKAPKYTRTDQEQKDRDGKVKEYVCLTDGAIFEGESKKFQDKVWLLPEEARNMREHGIALADAPKEEYKPEPEAA